MILYLSPIGAVVQFLTNLAAPLSGGLVNVYVGGSVSTPQASYTDATATTLNSNPLVLNSAGRMVASNQPVSIWVPANTPHKVVISDAAGNLLFNLDGMYGINDPTAVLASLTSSGGISLFANAVRSYDIFASMRAAPAPAPATGDTVVVIAEGGISIGDQLGGAFYWAASSTATDDNFSVIKPTATSGSGRWLRLVNPDAFLQNIQNSDYTLVAKDSGSHLYHSDATPRTWTIPLNSSVPFPIGTVVQAVNLGTGAVTVSAIGGVSLYSFQNHAAGSVVLAQYQSCRLLKVASDTWMALDAVNYSAGTFVASTTGNSGATGTLTYKVSNNRVSIWNAGANITGVSTSTALTFTGLPAAIQPTTTSRLIPCVLQDNSVNLLGWAQVSPSGTVVFSITGGFTAANNKGLPAGWTISYDLDAV